jgi:hypothetical protein
MAAKKAKKKTKASAPEVPRKAAKHRDAVELKRETLKLPVPVGDDVVDKGGREMAKLQVRIHEVEEEKSVALRGFRKTLEGFSSRMDELADTVNNSTELKDVECMHRLLPTGQVEVVRLDTQEVVDEHTATTQELQVGMPGIEGGKEGKDDDDDDVKGPKGKGK